MNKNSESGWRPADNSGLNWGQKSIEKAGSHLDHAAQADWVGEVYNELRRLAQSWLGKLPPGQTLSATALVHEAYLRLAGNAELSTEGWEGKVHFFSAAAQTMRHILVDQARRKGRYKHGGGWIRLSFNGNVQNDNPSPATLAEESDEILHVDAAIDRLKQEYPRQGEVVMLHFFAGLTHEEIAQLLQVTTRTIERDWRFAKAWLHQALEDDNQ